MKWHVIILCILLSGCYNQRKATSQFGKAVTAYPKIGADYCAITYPPKEKLIKGDSVIVLDTIYTGGETFFDTVYTSPDTVLITKTVTLPAKVINKTITLHDTLVVENTAALKSCQLDNSKMLSLLHDKTKEADKWRKTAKKRFWIIAGMGAAMALGLFLALRRKVVKKVLPIHKI